MAHAIGPLAGPWQPTYTKARLFNLPQTHKLDVTFVSNHGLVLRDRERVVGQVDWLAAMNDFPVTLNFAQDVTRCHANAKPSEFGRLHFIDSDLDVTDQSPKGPQQPQRFIAIVTGSKVDDAHKSVSGILEYESGLPLTSGDNGVKLIEERGNLKSWAGDSFVGVRESSNVSKRDGDAHLFCSLMAHFQSLFSWLEFLKRVNNDSGDDR